ncbi:MAG TPA: TIGR00266 family protein [Candidatus Ozemobacteraceae bacterium]|nr:TIGR00266 family protein [Candidatus Ozemobacteraceae bacterium]
MSDAKMWYVIIGGQIQGPMGAEDIIARLHSGAIKSMTMAHADGITKTWTPLSEIAQFANALQSEEFLPPVPTAASRPQTADVIDYNIFGDDLQFVEIELDPGESVVSEAGAMMYMDQAIQMETIFGDGSAKSDTGGWFGKLASAGKRLLTGESLFMTVFAHKGASGKAKVAFAAPYPGKVVVVDLKDVGGTLLVQKESFLCGAKGVAVGIGLQKKFGVGLFGGEGFIMQKLEGDGLVFCHAGGTIISRDLQPGEKLKIDTGCIVGYQPSVNFDVEMVGGIKSALFGGEGLFLATLTGPGRIWLQSLPFSRFASRIYAAAKQTGGGGKEEGSVLGGVFNMLGGKD